MSNASSQNTPTFDGEEFNRLLEQLLEENSNPVFSQDAQRLDDPRIDWLSQGSNSQHIMFRYAPMNRTGDSGYLTNPESPIILMDNWQRYFPSPIHEPSEPQNTPPQYNVISSPDLFPELESSSSIDSPNMLIPHAPIRLHTMQPSDQPSVEMDWSDDGNNEQLYRLMDKYEGWSCDYDEINELLLKKT